MSRRQRCAKKKAVRAQVARAKVLRRRARKVGASRVATAAATAAVTTLAGVGASAAFAIPNERSATVGEAAVSADSLAAQCPVPSKPSGDPGQLVDAGGTLFFTADDGIHGRELWKSDGTAAGTALVKDIDPDRYRYYDDLYDLTAVGGTLFFTVKDGTHGRELWKSNGTAAGTVLVKDINPNDQQLGGGPKYLTAVGDTLFFTARDGTHGRELWRSNGTAAGTVLVKDITPGNSYYYGYPYRPGSYRHHSLTAVGNTLFFVAKDGTHGQELWRSDGTKAGTVLVKDIYPGGYSSGYYGPADLAAVGGRLFFTAEDSARRGAELWRSDGSRAGTVLVKDIKPGDYSSSYPSYGTDVGGTSFFTADDGSHGRELWRSNGTAAGTVLVKDIKPRAAGDFDYSSHPDSLTGVGRMLFFTADDGNHGYELWKSNGTKAGTVLVKDIQLADYSSNPGGLTALDGRLFFTAGDGTHGGELWKSDGTKAGTVMVKDINPCARAYGPAWLTDVEGRLFFAATDGTHGRELWKSNGTKAGTVLVKDINGAGS